MNGVSDPPSGQNRVERAVEQAVIWFAKAMVGLGIAVFVYGFLVVSFFFCCGPEFGRYLDPRRSPLGAAATVAALWPVVGFLCFALQGSPKDYLDLVKRVAKRAWHAVRRGAQGQTGLPPNASAAEQGHEADKPR